MLHQSYSQTPAKVLESGIIDDLFMKRSSFELQNRIRQRANGAYTVTLAHNIELFVCFIDEFNPIDDGHLYNIQHFSNNQWLSLIMGDAQVQYFIEVMESDLPYIKEPSTATGNIRTCLYRTGKDDLDMNDSVIIEENKITTIDFNPERDLMLLRYRHTINLATGAIYYKEKPYEFYEYLNEKSFIQQFKKQIRKIINDAEACSRLSSRLKNPFE